jgi:hypothetical protein
MNYKKCIHCNKKKLHTENFFIGLLRKKEETIVKNALISWEHVKSVGVLTLKKVEKNIPSKYY